MKIFENLFKVEDFSTLIEDFLKIEKSSTFTKICENLWKFLKIRYKLKIFQILIKPEDYSNFGQNPRYLKIWSKLEMKIFENLAQIKDFSNFGKNWRFCKF